MYRPLVAVAVGFTLGILLASRFGMLLYCSLAILLVVSLLWTRRPDFLLPFLAAAVLGLVWFQVRSPLWPGEYGAVASEVRVVSVESASRSSQLTVRLLRLGGKTVPVWNRVLARLTLTEPHSIAPGDTLSGVINWREPGRPANPGEFSYGAYWRRQGTLANALISDLGTLEHNPSCARSWSLRENLLQKASRLPGSTGELLSTLTLGTSPGPWAESWRQTGLAHVLSISGLHIGLILVALLGFLRFFRLSTGWDNLIGAAFLLLYGYILGPKPAVWRAIIMALVGMLAVTNKRVRDWPSAVSLAAILLLFYNPYYLWDAGWQLSFAATIGLLWLSPLIRQHLPVLPWKLDLALSASLAAQLATFPLVLYHFYLVTPLSLFFNMAITPLLPVVLVLGLLFLLLPWVGDLLLPLLELLYGSLLRLVDWFARWPLASISPGAPPSALLLLYTLLLLALFFYRERWRPYVAAALVVTCVLLLSWQPLLRFTSNTYNLCVLSVGQGSAAALHLPGGEAVLFDVGGGQESVGRQIIVPYLRYRGTWKIQSIYLSHLHDDHIQGLADVLAAFPVENLYLPAASRTSPALDQLLSLVEPYGVPIHFWTRGDTRWHMGLRVTALNPLPGSSYDDNEDSLVLLLEWPNLRVLLPGDIGESESVLLPVVPSDVDVFLVPHHGSAQSSREEFLRLLRPEHAIISVGASNRYGHPAPSTLERLARYCQHVWRTDQHGAITILNSHHGHRVIPFHAP